MKKLLTILSFLIAMICGHYEAEAQQCLCDDLMAGATCCFTSVINYNGCPITYTACFSYDTLNYILTLETTQIIVPDSCYATFNLVDLQDSISYSVLMDSTAMPRGNCWSGIPDCPVAICGFNINYFSCYKKIPMIDENEKPFILIDPCKDAVKCTYFETLFKDENGELIIFRNIISESGVCQPESTPNDPDKEFDCISSCNEE